MKSGLFITLLLASAISMFAVPKDNCVFSGDDDDVIEIDVNYIRWIHTNIGIGGQGHAWVCEGYRYTTYYYDYELKVLSVVPPLQYEHLASDQSSQIGSANYFYYNLGYGGEGDGWYYAGNDFYTPAARFENLKMIYNITPPTN